jgi:hypothetical protein
MVFERSIFFVIVACLVGMFAGARVSAAESSMVVIARTSSSNLAAPKAKSAGRAQVGRERARRPAARAETLQRADHAPSSRIVAYTLFGDPLFKLPGAVRDKRQLGVVSNTDFPVSADALPGLAHGSSAKTGLAFDCREKPGYAGALPRRVTACYKVQLDKFWKTQTYLSKGINDSNSDWRGGVAVSYAH